MLPRTDEKSERAVVAAEWGTEVHKWVETGALPKGRIGTTFKKKLEATGVTREEFWPGGLHEVPVAYNVLTGAARAHLFPGVDGEKQSWKDSFGDDWITGTVDYVGVLLDAPWVDDLKTGRKVEYENYKYQQGFYTLAWVKFYYGELLPARSTITHWPKYPIPNRPMRFGTVLEPEFLHGLQGKLKQLREDVMRLREFEATGRRESVVVRLSDGPQCGYCPSRLACVKGLKYEL